MRYTLIINSDKNLLNCHLEVNSISNLSLDVGRKLVKRCFNLLVSVHRHYLIRCQDPSSLTYFRFSLPYLLPRPRLHCEGPAEWGSLGHIYPNCLDRPRGDQYRPPGWNTRPGALSGEPDPRCTRSGPHR